ncbi:hypothetical protein PV04_08355 [Phialophora macrospora]|uniref:Uncharacterized protein n=1 Tax=Phialophora macrospora TaxID=1851006 RepID=A0A0D2G221_9EURO|nr:hypothetical protein PV04_08355 [Phialophora macrospora]
MTKGLSRWQTGWLSRRKVSLPVMTGSERSSHPERKPANCFVQYSIQEGCRCWPQGLLPVIEIPACWRPDRLGRGCLSLLGTCIRAPRRSLGELICQKIPNWRSLRSSSSELSARHIVSLRSALHSTNK